MSADWGPVVVAVVMFILLSPGLLFQLPARTRVMEFGNMSTSGIAILVHAVIYFCIITILTNSTGIKLQQGSPEERQTNIHRDPERRRVTGSAGIDVDVDDQDENGIENEEEESVDSDGLAVGLHAPKLQRLAVSREREEQPWLQQYKQHHSYQYWAPTDIDIRIEYVSGVIWTGIEALNSQPFNLKQVLNVTATDCNYWAAPLIASALFAFLLPGLVFQMPGKERPLEFMNMKTSIASMFLHAVIYDYGMNQYGHSTRLKVSELHEPALSRHLNQQSWCQQYEQHHCYENRPPIRHIEEISIS
ncbi:unnamed protein product [Malus baccata var. baccata]